MYFFGDKKKGGKGFFSKHYFKALLSLLSREKLEEHP